jgi:putative FmdB family regulatory protein
MPTYVYQCPHGHETERVQSIHDALPGRIGCNVCAHGATRKFLPPAAIHYKGRGFYSTDVKGAQERRRRPNPGDDLPNTHQPDTAAIARSL